jgi:hypothetical protein
MSDPRGAVCKQCYQHVREANDCKREALPIYGTSVPPDQLWLIIKLLEPIKFDEEVRFDLHVGEVVPKIVTRHERCHACGAKRGFYHHPGCGWEECPNCHCQLLACGGHCGGKHENRPDPRTPVRFHLCVLAYWTKCVFDSTVASEPTYSLLFLRTSNLLVSPAKVL